MQFPNLDHICFSTHLLRGSGSDPSPSIHTHQHSVCISFQEHSVKKKRRHSNQKERNKITSFADSMSLHPENPKDSIKNVELTS